MATIYKADGTEEKIEPQNGKTFGLEELQAAVGGNIEIVQLLDAPHILVCNEDGKRLQLPINDKACRVACEVLGADYLRGDIIYCRYNEEGDMLP